MIEKEVALGINCYFGSANMVRPAILIKEYDPLPIGTPILIIGRENPDSALDKETVACTFMNCSQRAAGSISTFRPRYSIVKEFGDKNLIEKHKMVEIEYFNPSKTQRLIEYVHDVGSLSMCIYNDIGQRSFPKDLFNLINAFKYHNINFYNSWFNPSKFLRNKKDSQLMLINLFDLPYSIPIFNFRKVDGIGISCNIITEHASIEYGRPHCLAKLDMVLNNYRENLLIVDGSYVAEAWEFGKNIANDLQKLAERKLNIAKENSNNHKQKYTNISKIELHGLDKKVKYDSPVPESPPDEPQFTKYNDGGIIEQSWAEQEHNIDWFWSSNSTTDSIKTAGSITINNEEN